MHLRVAALTLASVVLLVGGLSGAPPLTFLRQDVVAGPSEDVASVDVNSDGLMDLASLGTSSIAVFPGAADGTYGPSVESSIHVEQLGDLDGDGIADAVGRDGRFISIAMGEGDGHFGAATLYPTAPGVVTPAIPTAPVVIPALSDVTGDGRLDVVTMEIGQTLHYVRVYAGLGDGTIAAAATTVATTEDGAFAVALGHFNADAAVDIASVLSGCGTVAISLNQGGGGFTGAFVTCAVPPEVRLVMQRLTAADLDGNGTADLIGTRSSHAFFPELAFALVNADGTHDAPTVAIDHLLPACIGDGTCGELGRVAVEDLDGDGFVDLAIANRGGSRWLLLRSTGAAQWDAAEACAAPGPTSDLIGADVDRDGSPDLVVGGDTAISLFLNRRPGRGFAGPRSPFERVRCRAIN